MSSRSQKRQEEIVENVDSNSTHAGLKKKWKWKRGDGGVHVSTSARTAKRADNSRHLSSLFKLVMQDQPSLKTQGASGSGWRYLIGCCMRVRLGGGAGCCCHPPIRRVSIWESSAQQTRPIKHFKNRYNMGMTTGTILRPKSFIHRGSKKPRIRGER